jgi:CRP-like cAMP-binding protein
MDVRTPPAAPRRRALLDLDADLAEAIDPGQRAYARRALTVPMLRLEQGPWDLHGLDSVGGAFGVMVTSGLVVRDIVIGPSPASELLGPGDVVEAAPPPERMLPASVHLSVAEPATVAVLDERILAAIRAWPGLGAVLIRRLARQEARQATHRAIAQLPRVEQRVVALFWHLAERWGRVTSDGVALPLALTHETIGRLVGARRPTVSLALKELSASGAVRRRSTGAWLLDRASVEDLVPDERAWRAAEIALVAQAHRKSPVARPSQAAVVGEFERLRLRVRMLEQLHTARTERTLGLVERCRATREAVLSARARRATPLAPITPPR